MNKKNIHLEKYWENMYQLHGTHPNVDDETSRELKRKGFFAGCHLWYDFERHDPSLYVNDRAMCYLHPINGWLSKLIDDKRFCPLLFRNRPHLIPELSIGIEDGVAKYVLENGVMRRSDLPLRKLFHMYCGKYGELLGKPAGLSGGAGIFLIGPEHIERAASQIDHKHAYLINNRLNNEEYAQRINPYGLNTIRCYFFRGKDGIKILTIVHRFGTSGSKYVDNVSA